MNNLIIEITTHPNATVVSLVGPVDLANADQLERSITTLCARHMSCVIFDLSRTTFVSSLGMGMLLRYRHAATHWSGQTLTAGTTPIVAAAFQRARLEEILNLRPSVEVALAEVSK